MLNFSLLYLHSFSLLLFNLPQQLFSLLPLVLLFLLAIFSALLLFIIFLTLHLHHKVLAINELYLNLPFFLFI